VPKVVMLLKMSRIGREILRMAVQRYNMKAHRGSRCIVPLNLNLGIGWKWAVTWTPRPLYPRYLLNRRLIGVQGRSGRFGKEKNLLTLSGFRRPPARSLLTEVERVQIRYFSSPRVDKYFNSKIRWRYLQTLTEISGVTKSDFRFDIHMSVHRNSSFISFSSLSYDRFKTSSKASSPHRAIQSFLFQMRISSSFLKVIQ
jgi:hypothetical protein